MRQAHHVDTFDEVLDVARTANDNFLPPMKDAEVIKIAQRRGTILNAATTGLASSGLMYRVSWSTD